MKVIIRYIILNSLRNKLLLGIIGALILSLFLSVFLGDTNLIEERKAAIALYAGCSRIFLVIGMLIFVCLNISNLFNNKEIDFLLAKSISREKFVIAILLGYLAISVLMVLIAMIIAILFLGSSVSNSLIWSGSLLLEISLISCFALLSSLILENSLLAIFSSIGFYILSRLMSLFTLNVDLPWQAAVKSQTLPEIILKLLSIAFPRIDLFSQSIWLSEGVIDYTHIALIIMQAVIFITLMIFMSFNDISKKEF